METKQLLLLCATIMLSAVETITSSSSKSTIISTLSSLRSTNTTISTSMPTLSSSTESTAPTSTSTISLTQSTPAHTDTAMSPGLGVPFTVESYWNQIESNQMHGKCTIPITSSISSFHVNITLSFKTNDLEQWIGTPVISDINGLWYYLKNNWTEHPPSREIEFLVKYDINRANPPNGRCILDLSGRTYPATTSGTVTAKLSTALSTERSDKDITITVFGGIVGVVSVVCVTIIVLCCLRYRYKKSETSVDIQIKTANPDQRNKMQLPEVKTNNYQDQSLNNQYDYPYGYEDTYTMPTNSNQGLENGQQYEPLFRDTELSQNDSKRYDSLKLTHSYLEII